MFEAAAGELRAKLVGAEKVMRNSGFPQRIHSTVQTPGPPHQHTALFTHCSHESLRVQIRRGADLAVDPSVHPINTVQVVPEGSSIMSRRHCSGP